MKYKKEGKRTPFFVRRGGDLPDLNEEWRGTKDDQDVREDSEKSQGKKGSMNDLFLLRSSSRIS